MPGRQARQAPTAVTADAAAERGRCVWRRKVEPIPRPLGKEDRDSLFLELGLTTAGLPAYNDSCQSSPLPSSTFRHSPGIPQCGTPTQKCDNTRPNP